MKSKIIIICALLLTIALMAGCKVGMINNILGGGDSQPTDKESLMKQANIVSDTIIAGYMSMLQSKIHMYMAAGQDAEASKYNDQYQTLKNSDNKVDAMNTIDVESTASNVDVEDIKKKTDFKKKSAKANVKEAAINAIVAVGYDTFATKRTDSFIKSASEALSANPAGLVELKPHLDLAQKMAPYIPDQIHELSELVKYYAEYSKDKSIFPVNKAEVDNKAAQRREDAGADSAQFDSEGTAALEELGS